MAILKGFKFGLILQLAVGPLCLLTFNTALTASLLSALIFAGGIVIGDTIYIIVACLGSDKIAEKTKKNSWLKYIIGIILIGIGIEMLINIYSAQTAPLLLPLQATALELFLRGIVLTLANPMTIIFWCGALASQIIVQKLSRGDLWMFALGNILSSALILSLVALLGAFTGSFLPPNYITLLNISVSLFLIYCGLKTFKMNP